MDVGTAGLILHVDDERSVRDSLSMLLRTDNYEVRSASSGSEALQVANEGFCPDVLIVDFNLGQPPDGAEIAEQHCRVLGYPPSIIMLTGDVNHAKFPRISDAIFWLTRKPLNPQLLMLALPGLVQVSRATRNLLTASP